MTFLTSFFKFGLNVSEKMSFLLNMTKGVRRPTGIQGSLNFILVLYDRWAKCIENFGCKLKSFKFYSPTDATTDDKIHIVKIWIECFQRKKIRSSFYSVLLTEWELYYVINIKYLTKSVCISTFYIGYNIANFTIMPLQKRILL